MKQGKHDRETIARRELRRDRRFKAQLSLAYGTEKVPRSLSRALEKTYESLPKELICKPRPLRAFARGAAGFAVFAAVLLAALLWVNAAAPQVTESLPGLGGLFQSLNRQLGKEVPDESEAPPFLPPAESTPPESSAPEEEFAYAPLTDNGITLQSVVSQQGTVTVVLEAPFMGRFSYIMPNYQNAVRLGSWASIATESGEEISLGYGMAAADLNPSDSLRPFGWLLPDSDFNTQASRITWEINAGRFQESETLVFTLYESGLWYGSDQYREEGDYGDYSGVNAGRRVLAEFTLRRDGRAKVSQTYLRRGLKKITPQEYREADRSASFQNGWMAGAAGGLVSLSAVGAREPDYFDTYFRVEAFSLLPKQEPTLNCYLNGMLVTSVTAYDWTAEDAEKAGGVYGDDLTFLNEEITGYWYGYDTGFWINQITNADRTGKCYGRYVFAVPISLFGAEDYAAAESLQHIRFELEADGEIVLEDMSVAYMEEMEEIISAWDALSPSSVDFYRPLPSPVPAQGEVSSAADDFAEDQP